MKTYYLLTFFINFIFLNLAYCQDKSALAQVAYMKADAYFIENDYKNALNQLDFAEKYLGKTNSKILYLKINILKSQFNQNSGNYHILNDALDQFFSITKSDSYPIEKYLNVVKIQSDLKEFYQTHDSGEKFLVENKKKINVNTTPSGLQYIVLVAKDGPKPKPTDSVKVDYQGFLIDGTKFDSSIDRGEPVTFPLNQVIPGWSEGVQLMSVGSKYKFFVPYTLGYGENDAGNGVIPGFSTLIYEVELLEIKPLK